MIPTCGIQSILSRRPVRAAGNAPKYVSFQSLNSDRVDRRATRLPGSAGGQDAKRATNTWPKGEPTKLKKEWDAALEAYEKALSEDPAEIVYQMASTKVHFQAAQSHIDNGLKLRSQGQLGDALLEFQKAYAINPGSAVATQEIRRTTEMIERERKRVQETGKESSPKERALTEGDKARKETEERISSILPVPRVEAHRLQPDPSAHERFRQAAV